MAKFKSLNIGDTVRVVSLADTEDRCGFAADMLETVGGVYRITRLGRNCTTGLGRVELANYWWYSPKDLEVVKGAEPVEPTCDEHGVFVTADTPVGTTVVYIGGDGGTLAPSGTPLELKHHDGDDRPRVEVIDSSDPNDYYYPDYKYLRVHVDGTVSTTEPTEPTPEPTPELTAANFKYTRVCVKETGAKGVIVGRTDGGSLVVLHDEVADYYHSGLYCGGDAVGVQNRMYYYDADQLEIIGGVQ